MSIVCSLILQILLIMNIDYYDILYLMLVSNNSLLNILLPNENKVLKDVLKEADSKTLTSMKSQSSSVGDILKNLFSDLKTQNQSKTTIENILKNSSMFKDLGSFTKSITTLLNQLETNSNLEKYKPILQSFLKDISTMDNKSLKELIKNSGVFLESKALEQLKSNTTLPKNLETILNQIKTILKDIPTLEAKKVESLIDKLLQNNVKQSSQQNITQQSKLQTTTLQNQGDLKSIVSMLQSISKGTSTQQLTNLTNLTNSLRTISSEAQLVESRIVNNKTVGIEPQLANAKQNITSTTQQTLTQLKNEVLLNNNIPNKQSLLKQIDTLLQNKDLFTKNSSLVEPKNLLSQLTNLNEIKTAAAKNPHITNIVSNLKNASENISTLENKVLSNQNIKNEKLQLTQDIKQNLSNLKNELINIKTIDTKVVNQIIDKLQNMQNLFSKIDLPVDLKGFQQNILNQTTNLNNFQSNFASNINNLILSLKENISSLSTNQSNQSLQNNIIKSVEKLETIINNIQTNSPMLNNKQVPLNPLQNDMKTVLLQMQEELFGKTDVKSMDSLKHVDKMLMQVEYYQLLSITSNSNSVYIPFLWDMLDDGSISMKQTDEEKFYCEINLSLKEFGQTQLLLSLYDKNKLDLTIYASKDSFKQSIKENTSKLKRALNSADLIPVNIKVIDLKKDEDQPKEVQQVNSFNQDINLGFGINIKA